MKADQTNLFDKIFRNKQGKIVIWQNPNIPLWGWIVGAIAAYFFKHGSMHRGLSHGASAFLFVWSYLEIRAGESVFRRILGGVVMASIIYGFFKP